MHCVIGQTIENVEDEMNDEMLAAVSKAINIKFDCGCKVPLFDVAR